MKKRIMCVFGTRPEAVKLAPVVHALQRSSHLEPVVVLTAQHREMLDQMLRWFEISPDYDMDIMKHGQSLSELTARVITGIDDILQKVAPDMLLVQGDTVTVMAAALAAHYHKVPVGHVEAGLRTEDRYNPFPEEMSRRLTTRLATCHFAPTQRAVENLRSEGIVDNVFKTGNTVIDALLSTVKKLEQHPIDTSLFGAADFEKYKVLLVTAHRRENWGISMNEIAHALRTIAEEFPEVQILYPIHKNPIVRESIEPVFAGHPRLILIEPLDYVPFVWVMQRSHFVLTDSGGIQEEAPTLGKPVLVLRTNTERPEAAEAGVARIVGVQRDGIISAARDLLSNPESYKAMASAVNPFGDGSAAQRITEALEQLLVHQPLSTQARN
ncbi:MAG: UDP-N-acetylglucosamine 2-epimerase (non-hydrolyzing) [Candidatus Obscuribacterales bacterium]|nr:UDP-N-acetylglucosamine 2-epimerase (non-hydrolyzing) [Candidatus Obscuribacterales bacterium]